MKITDEVISRIKELIPSHSASETASIVGCGIASVFRIMRDHKIVRNTDDKKTMRSRIRTNQVHAERRRVLFGLDQKTNIKVVTNTDRNSLKYRLRRKHYIFTKRGDSTAYYDADTIRDSKYEEMGGKLGIRFVPYEAMIIQ